MGRLRFEEAYSPGARQELGRLVGRVTLSTGGFAFYPVACSLPEPLIEALSKECQKKDVPLERIDLSSQLVQDLRQRVLELTPSPRPEKTAIIITGLEPAILLDSDEKKPAVLQIMNLAREGFQAALPCPFILCLSAATLGKVQEVAPDFWAWRKGATLKFEASAGHFHQELQEAMEQGETGGWDEAVARVGVLARLQETYEALKRSGEIGADLQVELDLAAALGDAYKSLRKYGKAQACYETALELARQVEDHPKLPQILNNLGIVLRGRQDPERSLKFFRDYYTMAEGQGDLPGQVAALNNIGLIYLDQGSLEEAAATLRLALPMIRNLSDQALCSTLGNLGVVLRRQGKINEAINLHYEALAISQSVPPEALYPWQKDLLYLGDAYAAKGWSSVAAACYEAARRVSRAAQDLLREKDALKKLGEWASRPAKDPESVELAELKRLENELSPTMRRLEERPRVKMGDTHVASEF